jgi:hypothetical protein
MPADNGAPAPRKKTGGDAAQLTVEDVETVKGLPGKLGADTLRRLLDVVG